MSQTASPASAMVEVELTVNGYVHDGLVRNRGDKISVTEAEAEELRRRGRIKILPLMRCLALPCLIGGRSLAIGETSYAPSIALAKEWYRTGRADIVNLDELGMTRSQLPPRVGEKPAGAPETVRIRATSSLHLSGLQQPNIGVGGEVDLPRDRAEAVVRAGAAVPVGGWAPRPARRVIMRAERDHAMVGNRVCQAGEIAAVDEEAADRLWSTGVASRVHSTPVRIRAKKPECFVGDRTLADGDVAEVHPEIAESLLTEGLAELTTDPVTPIASPKRNRP